MDLATILGLVIALACILGGNALEGGHLASLVQVTAGMIVMGGTIGATMISFPLPVFLRACKDMKNVFLYKGRDLNKLTDEIAEFAQQARRDGLVSLDSALGRHADPDRTLHFPPERQWTGPGLSHLGLLSDADVYRQLRVWLG